jgi:tRNA-splicing ligase RtcB
MMKQIISSERIPIKLWLDDIESGALEQARNLANLPFAWKWVAVMPDAHQGFGMPIGGVLATDGNIVPNAVGVDIGCGMYAAKTTLTRINPYDLREVLEQIKQAIPVGFEHQHEEQPWKGFQDAPDIEIIQQELKSAKKQLGTLGSGNHFIEVQQGSDDHIWVMIHSGSRNFGLKTAEFFHKRALALLNKSSIDLPDRDLAFLPIESRDGKDYFAAMQYCCEFALANRALMMDRISEVLGDVTGAAIIERINIHHNYAAFEEHYGKEVLIHRKGATKATEDTVGIIPGSMGTSSYIVKGLGNPESFQSCSHGAGRRMGRREAQRKLSLTHEQDKLKGIVHGLHSTRNLDEAPGAYKDIDQVMENQKDLVEITVKLKPLGSIKG